MDQKHKSQFDRVVSRITEDFSGSVQTNRLLSEAIRRIKQQQGVEESQSISPEDDVPSLIDCGPRNFEFGGLEKHFRACLDVLSDPSNKSGIERSNNWICSTHEFIEKRMLDKAILAVRLSPRTRDIRGWLAYFSKENNIDRYISAVAMAKPVFEAAAKSSKKQYPARVFVHFRPLKNLSWIYGYTKCTQVSLQTYMVGLDANAFSTLADLIFFKKKNQQEIMAQMCTDDCLKIQSDITALSNADVRR